MLSTFPQLVPLFTLLGAMSRQETYNSSVTLYNGKAKDQTKSQGSGDDYSEQYGEHIGENEGTGKCQDLVDTSTNKSLTYEVRKDRLR